MLLARVIGTVTATAKDARLTGKAMLLCGLRDGAGKALPGEVVAVDTVGAGVGDIVLITTGSAARMTAQTGDAPLDGAIIAVVDDVALSKE